MREQLEALMVEAGPAGLRIEERHLRTAACLVVAKILVDAEFGDFMACGVHPASGFRSTASVKERFATQVRDLQRRVMGTDSDAQSQPIWWNLTGIPPWRAADHLSMTGGRTRQPTRYNWYPGWHRRWHIFDQLALAVTGSRPALLYVSNGWMPTHSLLVLHGDTNELWAYDPETGQVGQLTRSQFVDRTLALDGATPVFIVTGTGRRARR